MEKQKRHVNIPIFIPHLGCPNDCVFCNQRSISGHMDFDEKSVPSEIEKALATIDEMPYETHREIAFFGGSFTGIDRELMISLLKVAHFYMESGRVDSIRLSTRPDYIDREILDILLKYGVKTVELGLQSMSDQVLTACRRGHTQKQAEDACILIKEYGFELIGQMMIGLPGATPQSEVETAKKICAMGADGARVYPTVVFYETELCAMAERGEYVPLTDEEAILRTKEVLKVFDTCSVPCIRVGLCASENLSSEEKVYGGANHSAIGELAMGEVFFDKMRELMDTLSEEKEKNIVFYVPVGATSKAVGQKRRNIIRLENEFFAKKRIKSVKILEKKGLIGYNILLDIKDIDKKKGG